jgi:hypothetical protein
MTMVRSHAYLEARIAKEQKNFEGSSSKKPDSRDGGKGCGQDSSQGAGRGKGVRFIDERRPRDYDKSKVKCFNCNETSHFAKECKQPDRRLKANLVKKGDDEVVHLLLMEKCVLTLDAPDMNQRVFLNERKVIPKLKGSKNIAWYLDTGASNHMTGCREKFAELDTKVTGSVKFGDGSIVEICGNALSCSSAKTASTGYSPRCIIYHG